MDSAADSPAERDEFIQVAEVVFESRAHARAAIFDYIEVFYDRPRIHQTLDYVSPV